VVGEAASSLERLMVQIRFVVAAAAGIHGLLRRLTPSSTVRLSRS
jgi:hypothetical protein